MGTDPDSDDSCEESPDEGGDAAVDPVGRGTRSLWREVVARWPLVLVVAFLAQGFVLRGLIGPGLLLPLAIVVGASLGAWGGSRSATRRRMWLAVPAVGAVGVGMVAQVSHPIGWWGSLIGAWMFSAGFAVLAGVAAFLVTSVPGPSGVRVGLAIPLLLVVPFLPAQAFSLDARGDEQVPPRISWVHGCTTVGKSVQFVGSGEQRTVRAIEFWPAAALRDKQCASIGCARAPDGVTELRGVEVSTRAVTCRVGSRLESDIPEPDDVGDGWVSAPSDLDPRAEPLSRVLPAEVRGGGSPLQFQHAAFQRNGERLEILRYVDDYPDLASVAAELAGGDTRFPGRQARYAFATGQVLPHRTASVVVAGGSETVAIFVYSREDGDDDSNADRLDALVEALGGPTGGGIPTRIEPPAPWSWL